jgi:hypothetical protein
MARAGYVETLQQVGSNVVATGSGTINTTGLGSPGFGGEQGYLSPSTPIAIVGGPTGGTSADDLYAATITGPSNFGPSNDSPATTDSGDIVGIAGIGANANVIVPQGYVSGDSLSSTSTFAGETFSSLSVIPGTYVWSWGEGSTADTYTLVASVPEPASLGMIGVVGFGMLARRRRRA